MQSILQYRRLQKNVRLRLSQSAHHASNNNTSGPDLSIAKPPSNNLKNGVGLDEKSPDAACEPQTAPNSDDQSDHQSSPSEELKVPTKDVEANHEDICIVSYEGPDDPNNPQNWTLMQKIRTTLIVLSAGIVGGWASANDPTIIPQAMKTFGVSDVVESLSTGAYLIAFGCGSLISGPFSETVGRNPIYIATLLLFNIFIMAAGLAPNIGAQIVFRFLAGIFGCTAVTTFAGSSADLWPPRQRALAYGLSSALNFSGIFLAPMVGAWIGQSTALSWRWTEWVILLMGGISAFLIVFFAPETYSPTILSWKATILRQATSNPKYRSDHELRLEPLWSRLLHSTWRPFDMLVHEPTIVLFTIYLTILYVVSFSFLTGYTFIYGDIYHMSQGSVGLCFLGLDVGIGFAALLAFPLHRKYIQDLDKAHANGESGLPPEERLWMAMLTAPCLPVGLFWMAWTANHSISFWCSLVGSTLIGTAFLGVFVSSYLYMIDSFESHAASALSVSTFARYLAAGSMIPVSIPMFKNLGVHWALTLLGCISVVLTPLPFFMWKYGAAVRKRSRSAKKP